MEGKAEGGALKGKVSLPEMMRGYSAYEIAVINGYKGTEKEWLESISYHGNAESWTFVLEDGTTVIKAVCVNV